MRVMAVLLCLFNRKDKGWVGKMTYQEVIAEIQKKPLFSNLMGAELSSHMLTQLCNPQDGMKIIHIAGTNGKGSVSAFLCSVFAEAGLKAGMFTSPHLVDFRERIRINRELISKEDTARIGEMLLKKDFGVSPTMSDYCLMLAILYFREQKCDVVILETGLGGKWDSTNAAGTPLISVITKIGYDHMALLGNTLEEIAKEKAGILKKGTHLIAQSQTEGVLQEILEAAKKAGTASCDILEKEEIKEVSYKDGMQQFSFRNYKNIQMQMLGVHQCENAAAAILAAEKFFELQKETGEPETGCIGAEKMLKIYGKREDCSTILAGIEKTVWQGRMEILSEEPFLLADGAHNSNGVEALRDSLGLLFPDKKFHFIMGVMADKDYETMVERILPLAKDFKTVTVEKERTLQAEKLAECIRKKGVEAECVKTLDDCLSLQHRREDTIIFGSLYFVAEVKKFMA